MNTPRAKPKMLKIEDLKRRCYALQDAVTERGMAKSGLMHTAARMLGVVGEILEHAKDVDGSEAAALARWVSDQHQELKIENERLREELAAAEQRDAARAAAARSRITLAGIPVGPQAGRRTKQ